MSFYSLLKLNPTPTMHDIEESFDGNLCRCTGYRAILESTKTFASDFKSCQTENCSQSNCSSSHNNLFDFTQFKKYDPDADLPFPKQLISKDYHNQPSLVLCKDDVLWLEPQSLSELLGNKAEFPNAKLIGGNSEVAIEMRFKLANYTTFINISNVKELNDLRLIKNKVLEIGCNINLTELIDSLKNLSKNTLEKSHKSIYDAFLSNLKYFASRQIRNFATLSGNIITGSPISDLNPILMANDAQLTLLSDTNGLRVIPIREFYLGYRKLDLKPDEVLVKLHIDLPSSEFEICKAYKQSKRKEDDIAIVNGCFRVKLCENHEIQKLDICYGGIAPTTIYLKRLDEHFKGYKWGESSSLDEIREEILKEINLSYSVPGGMPTYRRTLAVSFFTRFWYQICKELKIQIDENLLDNIDEIHRGLSTCKQDIGVINENDYCIGTTNPHLSGLKQTTGEAKYLDDIPKQAGELYTGYVLSTRAHAILKRVDASKALELPGVYHFVTHEDAFNNIFGLAKDEEIFASKEVKYYGHLIGLILADNRNLAKHAASLVEIEYELLLPQILTIQDAIEHNSFFPNTRCVVKGDLCEEDFEIDDSSDDVIVEGEMEVGGQEHFYLETQGCLVIPKLEDNEYEIFSSTQNLAEVQFEAAHALGISANRIVSRIKRIGGGFGGKFLKLKLKKISKTYYNFVFS
jgi:xanthine dehydrogenase/oxidase